MQGPFKFLTSKASSASKLISSFTLGTVVGTCSRWYSECRQLSCSLLLSIIIPALAGTTQRLRDGLSSAWSRKNISSRPDRPIMPPGPGRQLPFLGNFLLVAGKSPHVSLSVLARRYGPIMYLQLGRVPCVVVSSAAMVRACFKDLDHVFAGRPRYAYGRLLTYDCKGIGFAPYGPRWSLTRRLCTSHLFSSKKFDSFSPSRAAEISSMIQSIWRAHLKQEPVSISHKVFTMAANNIGHMVIGKRILEWTSAPTPQVEEFKRMINDFFWLVGVFNLGDHIPLLQSLDLQGYEYKMKQLHKQLDAYWEQTIQEHYHLEHERGECFLDFLISLTSSTTPESSKLNMEEVKGALMDLFAAGTDTTAVCVEWAMTELLCNPNVLKKAQAELDCIVGKNNMVQESNIQQLKYLQAIVKETLRLHPPSPLLGAREALDSCEIAGYSIPKGTRLIVNAWSLGHDESVWERPFEFIPERVLNTSIDVHGHNFELVPFGGGRRICMGIPLALCNVHFSLASLIHSFEWSLAPHETLDMLEKFGTALPKVKPLLVTPSPRFSKEVYGFE